MYHTLLFLLSITDVARSKPRQRKNEVGRCRTRGEYEECVTHTPPPNANNAAHSGFETQRRHHQKSKSGASVARQKGRMP